MQEGPLTLTETSPLLTGVPRIEESITTGTHGTKKNQKVSLLVELMGARHLPLQHDGSGGDTYCVAQYGLQTVHRTKPYIGPDNNVSRITRYARTLWRFRNRREAQKYQLSLCNPIWTVHEHALFTIDVTARDLANQKALMVYLWSRPRHRRRGTKLANVVSPKKQKETADDDTQGVASSQLVGQLRLPITQILKHHLNEERFEVPLEGALGNRVTNTTDKDGKASILAMRFRVASQADAAFCQLWNASTNTSTEGKNQYHYGTLQNPRRLLTEGDFVDNPDDFLHGVLVTEREDELDFRQESKLLAAAVADTFMPLRTRNNDQIRIKPYPDPLQPTSTQYMTKTQLKSCTQQPSSKWIQVGSFSEESRSLGQVHVEILSAHNLPNVDLGSVVGDETDAFCTIVYGDSIVQTDVISDELNPHWLPWTQRAFLFSMQHPAHMLYLAVFGYKRNPLLPHTPIGRVEINLTNFQNKTTYDLVYEVMRGSHAAIRASRGQLRLRLRLEMTNEREALLAMLRPPSRVYVNVSKKKSLFVARYTCCAEYQDEERFHRQVFDGYINEIDRYLKATINSTKRAGESLVFWRDQVSIFGLGLPVYSLLALLLGLALVHNPTYFPSVLCFGIAGFLFFQMLQRTKCPSPWLRPFSFSHYMRILLQGKSKAKYMEIKMNEGVKEMKARQAEIEKRMEEERRFEVMRESVERELEELEGQGRIQTKSTGISLELLVVLGKVQGIIGAVCRALRFIDVIVTWELSSLAFWITAGLIIAGMVALFVPWAFLFRLVGWVLVFGLLGPQNKLLDVVWNKANKQDRNDDQRVRRIFEAKFEEARITQEEAQKMKAFRQLLFGRYSSVVPSIVWTPRLDVPLSGSTAQFVSKDAELTSSTSFPRAVGHRLCGKMIIRPEHAWKRNNRESLEGKLALDAVQTAVAQDEDGIATTPAQRELSISLDQGLEVVDLFDEEAGFVRDVLRKHEPDQSMRELGIEIEEGERSFQFTSAWKSMGELPSEDILSVPVDNSFESVERVAFPESVMPTFDAGNEFMGDVEGGTTQPHSDLALESSYESSPNDPTNTPAKSSDIVIIQNYTDEFEIQPMPPPG